jgi:hypothetical protein
MSKGILEKMAVISAVVMIGCALWFWSTQVQSVIELLEMAG